MVKGEPLTLEKSVIVMTSNLGLDRIQELAGDDNYQAMKAAVMDIVSLHFRPEFINRIDESVVFHPLGRQQIRAIAKTQITYLKDRLQDRDLGFEIREQALDLLGEADFDPAYGARPLKRAIQNQLENPLANEILAGNFIGGDVVKVDVDSEKLTITK